MPLILNNLPPLHWAAAGAAITAVTLCLLFLANRRLGISAGFEDVCSLVLQQPYFARGGLRAVRKWRLPFVGGLVLGGLLSAVFGGGWEPTWELGMFDRTIGWNPVGKLAWMFVGGLFLGFGTPAHIQLTILITLLYILLGTIFGFVLSRSGAADYDYIQTNVSVRRFPVVRNHRQCGRLHRAGPVASKVTGVRHRDALFRST